MFTYNTHSRMHICAYIVYFDMWIRSCSETQLRRCLMIGIMVALTSQQGFCQLFMELLQLIFCQFGIDVEYCRK